MRKRSGSQRGQRNAAPQTDEQPAVPLPDEVTQGILHLTPFDADVPVIMTVDGAAYVPIRTLCELLNLAPAPWIAIVCARYRGDDAKGIAVRRLPYRPEDRTTQAEWCLDRDHVLRWFTFHLNPRHVPAGERHEQLVSFQRQMMEIAAQAHERQQDEFHADKREVIRRLDACATTLRTLDELDAAFGPHFEHTAPTEAEGRVTRAEFVAFVAEGRKLHEHLADALRAALQQMIDQPVIDAAELDRVTGEVVGTVAMPVLPQVPDLSEVNRLAEAAQRWFTEDLAAWMSAHGFSVTFRSTDAQ